LRFFGKGGNLRFFGKGGDLEDFLEVKQVSKKVLDY